MRKTITSFSLLNIFNKTFKIFVLLSFCITNFGFGPKWVPQSQSSKPKLYSKYIKSTPPAFYIDLSRLEKEPDSLLTTGFKNNSDKPVYLVVQDNVTQFRMHVLEPGGFYNDSDVEAIWAECNQTDYACFYNTDSGRWQRVYKLGGNIAIPFKTYTDNSGHLILSIDGTSYCKNWVQPYCGWVNESQLPLTGGWPKPQESHNISYTLESCVKHWPNQPFNPNWKNPCPTPLISYAGDAAIKISDITIPAGTTVSPGQSLVKTWRLKNTGYTTWVGGYKLAFISGEQMGAPTEIDVPTTSHNQFVDLNVNITAPSSGGTHIGYWRLRNSEGTYFGPTISININVQIGSNQITLYTDPPSPASADQVRIYARIDNFPNLRALRILVDGIQLCELGAPEIVDCVWHTNGYATGEHSIVAQADDWTGPSWDNPEQKGFLFNLTGGGVTNHAPYRPVLVANPAYDWYVTIDNAPQLCAQQQGDPDGDPVTQYRFLASASVGTVDSGWVGSSCHNFGAITPGTYEWQAQVKDSLGGISDWSDKWHFTVEPPGVEAYIDNFNPASPSAAEQIQIFACSSGHAGVNITLRVQVNDANDGTDSGAWHTIKELSVPCFNENDVPVWPTLEYADGPHLVRVIAMAIQPDAGDVFDTVYTLNHRRPNSTRLVAPVPASLNSQEAVYLNSQSTTFQWEPTIRAESYTLHISTNPSPKDDPNPVFRQTFEASVTQHTITFGQSYPTLYWQIEATNDVGSNFSVDQRFGIDQQVPTCAVSDLVSPIYESVFQVNWSGSDNLAGVRSYDVQYMDSERGTWDDWKITVPYTKTFDLFTGQPGHIYFFRCRATDNAANSNLYPEVADTSMTIDPSARPPTPWWNQSYIEKRNVTILNNMSGTTLPAGYPVRLHFDANTTPSAAAIYNASQANPKCDDLRVVANDTTELARIVQQCTSTAIDLWFRTQVSIPGGTNDNTTHQVYYGNPSTGTPPADPNQVWYPYDEADTTYLYFLQENSGSTAFDFSGNGRHCSINPSVQWSASKFGYGLRFNRANGGDSRSLNCGSAIPLTAFTVEFWYKPDANDGGRIAGQLAGGGNGGGGNNWLLQNFGGNIRLDTWECPSCGSQEVRSDFNLNGPPYIGNWNHIAVTFNGGNEVKFYINGALDSTKYLQEGGINTFTPPLEIGSAEGFGQIKANLGTFRISSGVKSSFPYGIFGNITLEPTTAAGDPVNPPEVGDPDLAILSLATYPNPAGGEIVQALVQNMGDFSTQNGFYTDLYFDHLPTGPGDYTSSLRFWVNDPIEPGEVITLTTIITDVGMLGGEISSVDAFTEISGTLFSQTDSMGIVGELDNQNNIFSTGTQICVASPDIFESDEEYTNASLILLGETQSHNFDRPGDQDWIKFDAVQGSTYLFRTSVLDVSSDTYLSLYDVDGTTLLAFHDDISGTLESQIEWIAPTTGTYYLLVNHWNPNIGGCGTGYTFGVQGIVFSDQTATGEVPIAGTITGNFAKTQVNDGMAEFIREVQAGSGANKYSFMEHKWLFDVQPGISATFYANAWASVSTDNDTFVFAFSTDNINYTDMFVVSANSDGTYQSFSLPSSISGAVYVRVLDTNRTPGHRTLDTIYVDHLYVQSQIILTGPPLAPSDLTATAVSTGQIDLTWMDHADNEAGFEIERSPDGINWALIDTVGTDVASHSDSGLSPGTTYYYRVRAFNNSGYTGYTNVASATTEDAASMHVGDLDGSSAMNGSRWNATVTITVHDANQNPLPGVIVTGAWSIGTTGTGSCTTNAAGQCNITKLNLKTTTNSVTFTVTGLSDGIHEYQPSANHDPDGDSNGTSIIVNKP